MLVDRIVAVCWAEEKRDGPVGVVCHGEGKMQFCGSLVYVPIEKVCVVSVTIAHILLGLLFCGLRAGLKSITTCS